VRTLTLGIDHDETGGGCPDQDCGAVPLGRPRRRHRSGRGYRAGRKRHREYSRRDDNRNQCKVGAGTDRRWHGGSSNDRGRRNPEENRLETDERPLAWSPSVEDSTQMHLGVTDLSQLSEVISHATAPAFLLGAVVGFVPS
jgi:hypothetical protein